MPARPEDDDKPTLPPPSGRLGNNTVAPVPIRPEPPMQPPVSAVRFDGPTTDPVASLGEPPEITIWGPPEPMTSYSLRVPMDWQQWMKAYTSIVAATDGLPEGVIPKVMGQFITENRDEIRRRANEAVHRDR